MKFANFIDEIGMPDLIGKVCNRFDIPDDSFFERFMQLLYWYISGLSEPSKVKKLVTKLFTFSKFQYVNDQNHHVMFINRLNFILLLALVCKVDLKTQLLNLLEGIENAKDAKLINRNCHTKRYKVAHRGYFHCYTMLYQWILQCSWDTKGMEEFLNFA